MDSIIFKLPASIRSLVASWLIAVRGSFWFFPGLLAVLSLAASVGLVNLDETEWAREIAGALPLPHMGIEGARQVVSTIAGSMITVASLVFSLTLIALTLMSQQLGPRLLPIFMNDRITQIVLGYFVAAFLFALIVLSTIGSGEKGEFLPQISVHLTSFLAIVAFGLMIYFVHHIARSIQADAVIAHLADQLDRAIEQQSDIGGEAQDRMEADERWSPDSEGEAQPLPAPRSGYIQLIEYAAAVETAADLGVVVRFVRGPGHFVIDGVSLADVYGAGLDEDQMSKLCEAVVIGSQRTPAQQLEYEFNALLEVAVRALSPGVNDPFTAMTCIDHLTDALVKIIQRPSLADWMGDDEDKPRVHPYRRTFEHYMAQVMHPLRQAASDMPQVLLHLAYTLNTLHERACDAEQKGVIEAHGRLIADDCGRHVANEKDQQDVLTEMRFLNGSG